MRCPTHRALHSRSRSAGPLMHQPSLALQNAVNPLAVDLYSQSIAQQRPQSPIPVGRMLLDQKLQLPFQLSRTACRRPHAFSMRRCQTRAADLKHLTDPSDRAAGDRLLYCSDVPGVGGWRLAASRRISMSMTKSPIFCFSFLICSSRRASSSLGFARRAFSAPSRPLKKPALK